MNKIKWTCPRRKITFETGNRVHWYEYSHDMIVVNGGYGLLIEIPKKTPPTYFSVLCDDGILRAIFSDDIDLEKDHDICGLGY